MTMSDTVIAVFDDHAGAETAIAKLAQGGFDLKTLSVVGKGYHTDEHVIGFYNAGDRITFWGQRGAFWGGLWGLFFGGFLIVVPVVGPVFILGYLATTAIAALEGAVLVGGTSALVAALYGLGLKKDSVIQYDFALRADKYLVMAHGHGSDLDLARTILAGTSAVSLDVHAGPANALVVEPTRPAVMAAAAATE